jgi:D-sedoheptulose 7-phosphate isomerase
MKTRMSVRAIAPDEIKAVFHKTTETLQLVCDTQAGACCRAAHLMIAALRKKKKILIFGNGGSAADSQHIAAELIGRFTKNRKALPAIALTTDTSILTSLANDFGFEHVFARQIEGLGNPGDVALALSTSGNSANVIAAVKQARKQNITTIALTGRNRGKLANLADLTLNVASDSTARIQECHITIAHILCEIIEKHLFPANDRT